MAKVEDILKEKVMSQKRASLDRIAKLKKQRNEDKTKDLNLYPEAGKRV